jgi:hypothetical protein
MSKETFWFSFRLLKPEPWIAEEVLRTRPCRRHRGDEAKALRIVKPLDGSGCHIQCLSKFK